MSIYPVKLSEWFPFGDENFEIAHSIVVHSRCESCGKRVRYNNAVAYHALPWGYSGEVWCSWKCCKSGKVAKPDKRRNRRMKRKWKKYENNNR